MLKDQVEASAPNVSSSQSVEKVQEFESMRSILTEQETASKVSSSPLSPSVRLFHFVFKPCTCKTVQVLFFDCSSRSSKGSKKLSQREKKRLAAEERAASAAAPTVHTSDVVSVSSAKSGLPMGAVNTRAWCEIKISSLCVSVNKRCTVYT